MPAERISAVIPCFNAQAHVAGAIESVLVQRQAGLEVEIIVVDDASTDGTLAAVAPLAAAHRDIVSIIRLKKNRGQAAARNAGLSRATGRLVCFLDSDDRYVPLTFARCVAVLSRRPHVAAVFFGVEFVNATRPMHALQREAVVYSLPSNMVVRRDVAALLGGFPEDTAFRGKAGSEDIAFKRALMSAFEIVVLADECLRYVVQPGSHLDYFLDRSAVVDGKLVVNQNSPEELSGAMAAASARYEAAVRKRLEAVLPAAAPRSRAGRPRR